MKDIAGKSLKELQDMLEKGECTSVDLTKYFLKTSKEKNKELNAYLEIFDDALGSAKEADNRRKKGEKGSLLGIPVAIKDNMLVEGKRVSAASKILENYEASYDAFVIQKLKEAGAVIIGRTNLDEFAMGGSTENSAFGVVKNPYDTTRVAGGSSGGSAAAVAMGGVPVSLGSDTGGSIREPAAFCGTVGLKPTYGTVSRNGLIAMGSSLDQIGPLGNSVDDVEAVFDVIKGHDPKDSTSLRDPEFVKAGKKLTIGVPRSFFAEGVTSDVLEHFEETLEVLRKAGHTVKDIELPYIKYSLPVYYIIMPAEASTNLSRFDGMRYGLHVEGSDLLSDYKKSRGAGFGREVRRRILLGTYVLSSGYYDAYYGKATVVRKMIQDDFAQAFKKCDAIATPTAPVPAVKIGEKADPVSMYLMDIFTVPANIAGIPGISVPMGNIVRNDVELPVGFQLMAPHLHEDTLFALGRVVESKKR
jgi:aspartyl-tRNA(Asn)/glutamyl-tRNA(Gln) amidotransferase subunit A